MGVGRVAGAGRGRSRRGQVSARGRRVFRRVFGPEQAAAGVRLRVSAGQGGWIRGGCAGTPPALSRALLCPGRAPSPVGGALSPSSPHNGVFLPFHGQAAPVPRLRDAGTAHGLK